MIDRNPQTDYELLTSAANYIRSEFNEDYIQWADSPFRWVLGIPSASKGKLGKRLVSQWCAVKGLAVNPSPDSDADLLINGHRVEIKFSTLWKSNIYKFQQIRNQNFEFVICLGVSPNVAHCWVIPKEILLQIVIGHMGQHGGALARDTDWITVNPATPPDWIVPYGGTLEAAYNRLHHLVRH